MEKISREFNLGIARGKAFQKFLNELNAWWPKEYTWSQDKLKEIRIDGQKDGLCTEIGPNGFRCDWGRVTELEENEKIKLKWQISPTREPVPDPEKASDIEIVFSENGEGAKVYFEHRNFENHGKGAAEYREMMASAQGWDYILGAYKKYCEK